MEDEEISELINYLSKNKELKLEVLSNIDKDLVLKLRNLAAESGIEMTPKEVKAYLHFIRDLLS
jgi:hypothetical protein